MDWTAQAAVRRPSAWRRRRMHTQRRIRRLRSRLRMRSLEHRPMHRPRPLLRLMPKAWLYKPRICRHGPTSWRRKPAWSVLPSAIMRYGALQACASLSQSSSNTCSLSTEQATPESFPNSLSQPPQCTAHRHCCLLSEHMLCRLAVPIILSGQLFHAICGMWTTSFLPGNNVSGRPTSIYPPETSAGAFMDVLCVECEDASMQRGALFPYWLLNTQNMCVKSHLSMGVSARP